MSNYIAEKMKEFKELVEQYENGFGGAVYSLEERIVQKAAEFGIGLMKEAHQGRSIDDRLAWQKKTMLQLKQIAEGENNDT